MRETAALPCPRGMPFLGNALQLDPPRLHLQLEERARRFGAFYRLRFGRRDFVVVADHIAIASMLRDRPDGFRRSDRMEQVSREMGLVPGVFGSNGEAWRRQRRMVMAGVDPAHVKA